MGRARDPRRPKVWRRVCSAGSVESVGGKVERATARSAINPKPSACRPQACLSVYANLYRPSSASGRASCALAQDTCSRRPGCLGRDNEATGGAATPMRPAVMLAAWASAANALWPLQLSRFSLARPSAGSGRARQCCAGRAWAGRAACAACHSPGSIGRLLIDELIGAS